MDIDLRIIYEKKEEIIIENLSCDMLTFFYHTIYVGKL